MKRDRLLELLRAVAAGEASPAVALERLAWLPIEEVTDGARPPGGVPFARIDHHRVVRQGSPEVILCEGKTPAQVAEICRRLGSRGDGFLATRADPATRQAIAEAFPSAEQHDAARLVYLEPDEPVEPRGTGPVLVVSAGTGDLGVAEEAATTARALHNPVERLYDVGVAGIHRLLRESAALREAAVVIVVAGMEGALASVVGGLVAAPVVAVPTSVGYGASFGGVAALLAMLNSCAAGVTVVNIDNGFGAACAATRINQLTPARPPPASPPAPAAG